MIMGMGRSNDVPGLSVLKSPDEQGTKDQFDSFVDKIVAHVSVSWPGGSELTSVLKDRSEEVFPRPNPILETEEKDFFKKTKYENEVKLFFANESRYAENKKALLRSLRDGFPKY